jgi:hypothetical protein
MPPNERDSMTRIQAITKAQKLSTQNSRDYYVLDQYEGFNDSRYQVADDFDLESFWCGISESRIIFCTAGI